MFSLSFFKKILIVLLVFYLLTWVPWIGVKIAVGDRIYHDISQAPKSEVGIVLGGLHYPSEGMSETNRERLLAARELLKAGKIDLIVVSNREVAARAMSDYLVREGVSAEKIIQDGKATITVDSCKNELADRPAERSVILLSHNYHLPRALYQCGKAGLEAAAFTVDSLDLVEREQLDTWTRFKINHNRWYREAMLTLASLLGLY